MAAASLDDYIGYWIVTGAGSPIPDQSAGARPLTLSGGATPPRSASYKKQRGAEFRTSTFQATEPVGYASPGSDGLNTALYASSKIKTFTFAARFRPNRSGSTHVGLTPIAGLFSATNMGGTPNLYNQPCFLAIPAASGQSKLLVFIGDRVFDTATATQTAGETTTTPISDEGWNSVAVVVVGSTTTNNQIDSVTVYTEDHVGSRRTYVLGKHAAAARMNFSGVPSNNDTVTFDGVTYTWKTSLGGTPATATIPLTSGTDVSDGDTVTIDGKTYTFRDSLTQQYATAVIEWNKSAPDENGMTGQGEVYFRVGGFEFYLMYGTRSINGYPSGYIDSGRSTADTAALFHEYLTHPNVYETYDGKYLHFNPPKARAWSGSGEYTTENGLVWLDDSRRQYWTCGPSIDTGATCETTITAVDAGAVQIPVVVIDGWKYGPTGVQSGKPATWRARVKSGTVDNPAPWGTYDDGNGKTQGVTKGGAAAVPTYAVKRTGTWATTADNLKKAILKTGVDGTNYSGVAEAHPNVASVSFSGATLTVTSKYVGTAGNGKTCSDTSTNLTSTNFAGGSDGSTDAHAVLIGATQAECFSNLAACVNHGTGAGVLYGNASSTAHTTLSIPTIGTGYLILRALTAGLPVSSFSLSKSCSAITSFKDEFNDVTVTSLVHGHIETAWAPPSGARPDNSDMKAVIGWPYTANGTKGSFYGVVGDVALSSLAWTDEDFVGFTTTPPPTSTRDVGWYRGASIMYYSAKTEMMPHWRLLSPMPTGHLSPALPVTLHGSRLAMRFWGVPAGHPFSVRGLGLQFRKFGGKRGPAAGYFDFPPSTAGLDMGVAKDGVTPAALRDSLNMTFGYRVARRRRGYKVLANDETGSATYPMAFFDATTGDGEVYHLVIRNGVLYQYDNGVFIQIDTGWPQNEIPTVATVGQKTFLVTSTRTRVFKQGSVFSPGVEAPSLAPTKISTAPASHDGVEITDPGWDYVYTYYDSTHDTDSGPSPSLPVVGADGTEKAEVVLGFEASGSSTVTDIKFWKRRRGTDTYFYVGSVGSNSSGTYSDFYDQPTTTPLEVYAGVPVTASWPTDIVGVATHEGRIVGWGGRRVYYSEADDGERWYPLNAALANHTIRAVVSHEGRDFLLTDRSVEIIEGNFTRGSAGVFDIQHRVLDESKGVFGPYAACVGGGRLWWVDPVGIHSMRQGNNMKDVTKTESSEVHPLIAKAIDTSGTSVVACFNHVSQEVWFCLTQTNDEGDKKNRVVLVYNVETHRWTRYDHALAFVARVNDGLFGQQFFGCDYHGCLLELDVYDGDGVQGNESWAPAGGYFTIDSISGNVVTLTDASLPTTLRGVSVVLQDLGDNDTPFYRRYILSSTATTITLDSVPGNVTAGDRVYIGGIIGLAETPELTVSGDERKTWVAAVAGLSDLTAGDL